MAPYCLEGAEMCVYCCSLSRLDTNQATFSKYIIFFHCGKGRGGTGHVRWDVCDQHEQKALPLLQNRSSRHWRLKMLINLSMIKNAAPGKIKLPGKASCHYVRR